MTHFLPPKGWYGNKDMKKRCCRLSLLSFVRTLIIVECVKCKNFIVSELKKWVKKLNGMVVRVATRQSLSFMMVCCELWRLFEVGSSWAFSVSQIIQNESPLLHAQCLSAWLGFHFLWTLWMSEWASETFPTSLSILSVYMYSHKKARRVQRVIKQRRHDK